MDKDLRTLEREAKKGDVRARFQWRQALLRSGRGSEAGIEVGDTIRVTENGEESYSEKPWTAVVTAVSPWEKDVLEYKVRILSGFEHFKPQFLKNERYKETAHVAHDDAIELLEIASPVEQAP